MSSDPTALPVHGEILTGVQRRRRWSTTEKIRLVEESQQPGSSVSFVARRYGLSPSRPHPRRHRGGVTLERGAGRSDHLELRCRDGAVVRVLFAIDACDREIMAWSATTTGVSAEMVCDLMIACCERRFGTTKTPHPVEWLSDNGSAYIAKETAQTAAALGLRLLFTPPWGRA